MINNSLNLETIQTCNSPFINYCPLIYNFKEVILIDPSWEFDKFISFFDSKQLKPVAVLLTHHHLDHSHLADEFAKTFNIPVYISVEEAVYYNFLCTNLKYIYPDDKLLKINNFIIMVIKTPGHTFGGICYLIDNYLFTGDTLFIEGCGICSGIGGSSKMMYNSLHYLKTHISKKTLIYPGHKFKNDIGQEFSFVLQHNIYLNFNNCDDFQKFRDRSINNHLNFV